MIKKVTKMLNSCKPQRWAPTPKRCSLPSPLVAETPADVRKRGAMERKRRDRIPTDAATEINEGNEGDSTLEIWWRCWQTSSTRWKLKMRQKQQMQQRQPRQSEREKMRRNMMMVYKEVLYGNGKLLLTQRQRARQASLRLCYRRQRGGRGVLRLQ